MMGVLDMLRSWTERRTKDQEQARDIHIERLELAARERLDSYRAELEAMGIRVPEPGDHSA